MKISSPFVYSGISLVIIAVSYTHLDVYKRQIFKSLTDPEIIAFAAGNPSAESFPSEFIKNESERIFREEPVTALQYGTTEGYLPLREAVAQRLKNRFGCGKDFDSTVIVSGGQQGIELTCKAFCNEGDVVICENPSFIGALNAFRSNGARPVGVRMESDGIDTNELEKVISVSYTHLYRSERGNINIGSILGKSTVINS